MKIFLTLLASLSLSLSSFAQIETITVTDQNFKLDQNEEFWFAFAKGDEVIINVQETKDRKLEEIIFSKYPSTPIYSSYKTSELKDHVITVPSEGIYQLKFVKGGLRRKVVNLKIQRTPALEETAGFNTEVAWETRVDSTTNVIDKKVLVSIDTIVHEVLDRTERVHSTLSDKDNLSKFDFLLPSTERSTTEEAELVSWAYWIGVGNENLKNYEKDKQKFIQDNVANASMLIDPIAGLALGAYSVFSSQPSGDNVRFTISNVENKISLSTFEVKPEVNIIAKGNSTVSSGRITDVNEGKIYFRLHNDNYIDAIDVNIKIRGVEVIKRYEYQPFEELILNTEKVPIMVHNIE